MAEQPIKSSEIIDNGVFSGFIKEADIVIAKEKEIISINKDLLKSYRDIANANTTTGSKGLIEQASNLKKVEASINELARAEISLIEVEKAKKQLQQEDIKLSGAIERQNKAQQRSLNQLNGEYKKGAQDLGKLKQQLKELEFTGRTNGKLYKALTNEFTNLDSKVRKAEKSVGEFQRNVGNYPKVLDSIGSKVAAAFSVGAVINFGQKILETRAQFQKYETVLTNTLGSSAAAARSIEQIQKIAAKTPFSVNELTESYVKLVNRGFKPTTEQITKLGDLAASQGKSFDQLTEALLDAQSGEFERLKEFGIRAKTVGDNVTLSFKGQTTTVNKFNETALRNAVLGFGELEGVVGGMAAISDTLGGKISNLGDNFDTFFNNLGKDSEGVFGFFLTQFNDFLGQLNESQTLLLKINASLKAAGQEQSFIDKLFGGNAQLVSLQLNLDKIQQTSKSTVETLKGYAVALSVIEKQREEETISLDEYNKSLTLIGAAIKQETESTKENTVEKVKNTKAVKDNTVSLNTELEKLRVENTLLEERRAIDSVKLENKTATKRVKNTVGNEKIKYQLLAELEIKLQQDLRAIKEKYAKEDLEYVKKQGEERLKLEKEIDDKILESGKNNILVAQERFDNASLQEDKKSKDRKDKKDKDLKEALEFESALIDAVAKAEAQKSQLRQDEFDKQITQADKNIETQRRLAERGKSNTLAEEEANKTKLDRQKEEEKQQEIKRQKVLAFFKLFSSYAEKDPNTALQKALRDTVLAEAVSAAFIDGTENVGKDKQFAKNKYSSGQDGYIARFDGDERILNPEQNKRIGNLSNDALADLAFKANNGLLDTVKYATAQSTDFASSVDNSILMHQNAMLLKELQGVKQAINDKPVHNFEIDKYDQLVKRTIQDGIETKTVFKNRKPRVC